MTAYPFHVFDTPFSPPRTTRPLSPKPSARPGTWQAAAQKTQWMVGSGFFKDPSWSWVMWLVVINVLGVSGWVWSLFVSDSIFVLVGGSLDSRNLVRLFFWGRLAIASLWVSLHFLFKYGVGALCKKSQQEKSTRIILLGKSHIIIRIYFSSWHYTPVQKSSPYLHFFLEVVPRFSSLFRCPLEVHPKLPWAIR